MNPLQWGIEQWSVVGVWLAVMAGYNSGLFGKLKAGISSWRSGTSPDASTGSDQDEVLDMRALHRLEARFKRLGCPEGQAALKTAGEHFFHANEAKPA